MYKCIDIQSCLVINVVHGKDKNNNVKFDETPNSAESCRKFIQKNTDSIFIDFCLTFKKILNWVMCIKYI